VIAGGGGGPAADESSIAGAPDQKEGGGGKKNNHEEDKGDWKGGAGKITGVRTRGGERQAQFKRRWPQCWYWQSNGLTRAGSKLTGWTRLGERSALRDGGGEGGASWPWQFHGQFRESGYIQRDGRVGPGKSRPGGGGTRKALG